MALLDILKKGKKTAGDFLLRISSSVLTTLANQVVLLPLLAYIFDEAEYGLILTLFGIKNIISGTLGNSLYSTRLIVNARYDEEGKTGDFNLLITIAALLSAVAVVAASFFFKGVSPVIWLLLVPVVMIYTLNAYLTVWYPVKLQFKKSFVHSMVVSVGTLIGAALVYFTKLWPLAYLASGVAGLCFILAKTKIFSEGFKKTDLMGVTVGKWSVLIVTTLLVNVVTYLDRLILYPLLGAEAVSTFSTASYFGKALSVVAMPVASVMLGYYAQRNFKMNTKRFWTINGVCLLMLVAFAGFSLLLGKPVTGLLFPKLIDDAAPYVFIANVSCAVAALVQIVQSAAMRYAKTYWQLVIQIVYFVIYFGVGLIMIKTNGLMGFCIASLIANCSRMVLQLAIGHFAVGGNNDSDKET